MALYKCECCKYTKEIKKIVIVCREGKWVTKGSECPCGKYMQSEIQDGMPQIIRTEQSLSKHKKHDKLWDSAKEKIIGERGINDNFK
tara:strand:+ start:1970 stop:2230 length:261 start_codon:yes stop_codon:yes gene_type:complete